MTVIVRDEGFTPETWDYGFAPAGERAANDARGLDLASDTDPAELGHLMLGVEAIRIDFPSFADGRGFTLARQLRNLGFQGRLRAAGHVISDQYAMARRSGFDEVEISDELAARQPEQDWVYRADWRAYDYRSRLMGAASA
ncbi:DUF934 domain-containing protein [Aliiroseovarius crassostreae]|uniref:DUF934 domain-containing protein n=1 Tax=Aliiroseovarius crassostreae TaxID=154981 RepID=UPI00220384D8|nr:DUF934 domain-containing protein [Aliiroseovarius crassostreae]UWQ05503.1 DUF934 domain-containing protein [Aliiroseovarius crassostreae]